ncbi:hypothetical protein BH10ACT3_BH10ACT3_11180 [soil metagenome]
MPPPLTDDRPVGRALGRGQHVRRIVVATAARLATFAIIGACAPVVPGGPVPPGMALVSSTSQGGWQYDYYRNGDRPCAVSGYQTFVVATRVGSDPTATAPLWVRMHGGGTGYFDSAGVAQPNNANKTEESATRLMNTISGGLAADVKATPEGFRMLTVSMCSHDVYAGNDTADPHNPNVVPSGAPVTTTGLIATKEAIRFVRAHYPTDDTFLHGGSAGSAGSFHVAWSMQLEGEPPTSIVADSGIVNQQWEQAQIDQGLPCALGAEAAAAIPARWDPMFADPANQPDLLVADGRLTVPVMHVWDKADHNTCGTTPMACERRDGSVVTLWSATCNHELMRLAIAGQGPASRSVSLGLCVDDASRPGPCDRHSPTNQSEALNTDPDTPADFNATILEWVRLRLRDD